MSAKNVVCMDISTANGRFDCLRYLYLNIPFDLFRVILRFIIDLSNESCHPITKELVSRSQLKLHRQVFFKMFWFGAAQGECYYWDKNFTPDITNRFCHKCGECKLVYDWNEYVMPCLRMEGKNCRHATGNYRCHRSIQIMGGYCYYCIQHINMPKIHTHFRTI